MALNTEQVIDQVKLLKDFHTAERDALDVVRRYWKGSQGLPAVIPSSAPNEVRRMAQISRVNICSIVVDTLCQSMFVDGFRAKNDSDDLEVWKTWQANKMDARQTGIHRAAAAYGTAYAIVLPGDPLPVIKGASPRTLTAVYGEDPDWPIMALEKLGFGSWRLFDEEGIYYVTETKDEGGWDFIEAREHGAEVTPVVRYLDAVDLDDDDDVEPEGRRGENEVNVPMRGQVAPLFSLQDQVDMTTFGLLVAQHYSAFRQRWAIGWIAPAERELLVKMAEAEDPDDASEAARRAAAAAQAARMRAGAEQLWTFDENPQDMQVGEFSETNLKGYIDSRDASLRHAAALSQTPVHELTGTLINMAAEALAAAEAGKDRKVDERQTLNGESHEQTLWLAGQFQGVEVPDDAQVVWRETSARSFAATVDALGKLTQMLGIPPQELWERVPGATAQDVQRWKAAAQRGDSFAVLADLLERQANGNAPAPAPAPAPQPA